MMQLSKHRLLLILALLLSFQLVLAQETQPSIAPAAISIIPNPVHFERIDGTFQITGDTKIEADSGSRATADYLVSVLAHAKDLRHLAVTDIPANSTGTNIISMRIETAGNLGDEGYRLEINPNGILISAPTSAGLFYAVQTLRQLLPPEIESPSAGQAVSCIVPCLKIEDYPRYKWRGLMLDVSRHFRTVAYVKRFLDLMALQKLNTFHWHLTDDQGWRIEIKKYPKLTEIGAWRRNDDGERYGGFYTQDEIREVIAYAAQRHITIVPEIEMPGHSNAAIASYPEFSCTGETFTIHEKWGNAVGIYCPGKEQTFQFLQDILSEVIDLFPGPFIHIGGDEVSKKTWHKCPDCQARMKAEGLKNEDELQSYFTKRIDAFVTSKGRRIIGWDEILQGGLAPGAAVMSWHGTSGAITAARSGHDVVLSPTSSCYFDHYQSLSPDQPKAMGGYLPIETVYKLEATPNELTPEQATHVLGTQGNLWSEYLDSEKQVDYMAFPRSFALAEAVWSPESGRNWEDFSRRLPAELKRLDVLGVHYFKDPHPGSGIVGNWSAQKISTTPVQLEWDITSNLKQSGQIQFIFQRAGGRDELHVNWAALLENGKEIARDAHASIADRSTDERYTLNVPKLDAAAKYTLKAEVQSTNGTDSNGRVIFVPSEQQE